MTAADRWVVGAAVALVASLYVWSWGGVSGLIAPGGLDTGGSDAAGVVAEVVVAGHPGETIDLGRDGEVEVQGRMGPSRLLVQDGQVRFTRPRHAATNSASEAAGSPTRATSPPACRTASPSRSWARSAGLDAINY